MNKLKFKVLLFNMLWIAILLIWFGCNVPQKSSSSGGSDGGNSNGGGASFPSGTFLFAKRGSFVF